MPIRNSSSTCRPNTSAISIPTAYGRDSVIEKKRKSSPEFSLRGGIRKGVGVINMKRKLSELLPLAPPTRRGQFLSSSREEERLTFARLGASGAQKAIIGVQREGELQSRFNEGA